MLNKQELLEAIEHCEDNLHDYKDCQRLASLYTIYNHKFRKREVTEPICEVIVQNIGDSEFLSAIRGKSACDMWLVMDKLMEELSVSNPRLYEQTLSQL
jgi:hypothetical protein